MFNVRYLPILVLQLQSILMGKRELVALLNLSFWCLLFVVRLFHAVSRVCLQFVIVVFPDHTRLLSGSWQSIKELKSHSFDRRRQNVS